MEKSMIYTKSLSVGYSGKVIIDGIEISVNAGEILTLIGPNGAGKSTILKTICRQLQKISGAVYINGKESGCFTNRELAKTISILMTERVEPEMMTCGDVVKSGRYPYTGQLGILSENDKIKVMEAMKLTSVDELADKSFNCISDGQRQRVMLARAICQEPELLILDEPTSFLDIHHKLELLSILKKLVYEKNIAVIMSMHEIDLAQKISDYVVCISGRGIDKCGTPEDIFTSDYISRLYRISPSSYNSDFGSVELECIKGSPEIFVIAGNGSGIRTFRRLQRMNIPFATGVLHENDIDYAAAKSLASQIISEKPFEAVSVSSIDKATKLMNTCCKVICCLESFGTFNAGNKQLLKYAEEKGYLVNKLF
ncbi:MAG: ABC transporter ATP-binding protein [Ruminococcus sp.]|nr:ABC transporter ATP-binding protein [Ruminococcus sp.]